MVHVLERHFFRLVVSWSGYVLIVFLDKCIQYTSWREYFFRLVALGRDRSYERHLAIRSWFK